MASCDVALEADWGLSNGSAALALINTLDRRSEADPIVTPAMFGRWLAGLGLDLGGAIPLNISHVRQARELRAAALNCVSAAIRGAGLPAADVEIINRLAAMPGFRPQLRDGHRVAEARNPRNAALSHLAADAIELLTAHRNRLRLCTVCNRHFVDDLGSRLQGQNAATGQCCGR